MEEDRLAVASAFVDYGVELVIIAFTYDMRNTFIGLLQQCFAGRIIYIVRAPYTEGSRAIGRLQEDTITVITLCPFCENIGVGQLVAEAWI